MRKLGLVIQDGLLPIFFKLLQQGFVVNAETGCSVKDLLCNQLGVGEDYLQNRIQTLFLNGMPVDDVTEAVIPNHATLALSGAMPGLVGATLRKGGVLAAMRNTISYSEVQTSHEHRVARVKIKLFNMILKELGPLFLGNGVLIPTEKFQDFLSRHLADLKRACSSVQLDGRHIKAAELESVTWTDPEISLQVKSDRPL
ncbi:MAG: hypothetical protein JRF29_08120 [Deltaproteobacteria bacterium]|jgi:hypothetical protein|nr:hypothetical protein [Deltaproteobacteria bacterium]